MQKYRGRVRRRIQHRLYQRYVNVSKKFYAHDEQGEARKGDTVRIVESRPLSKLKAHGWRRYFRRRSQCQVNV